MSRSWKTYMMPVFGELSGSLQLFSEPLAHVAHPTDVKPSTVVAEPSKFPHREPWAPQSLHY